MSDLSSAEKLELCGQFLSKCPPGQSGYVVKDLKALEAVGNSDLEAALPGMMATLNLVNNTPVAVPGEEYKVIVSSHGQVDETHFIDPKGGKLLEVNHVNQTCTGVSELDADQEQALKAAEPYRSEIQEALSKYVSGHYPDASVSVWGKADGNTVTVVVCYCTTSLNIVNYWAGTMHAEWTVTIEKGSKCSLAGTLKSAVHYFENGNVQQTTSQKFTADISETDDAAAIAAAVSKEVGDSESSWHTALEATYVTLPDATLAALRRKLPITKTKFDFNKALHMKVANELHTYGK